MNLSRDTLLSQLRQMDEYAFEHLVADVWEQQGWNTTVTTGSADRGIDVIAQKSNPFPQKHLIQVKRYGRGNKIGSPEIQQYSSLRQQETDVDAILVITTSSFSSQARQTARDLNVKLINGPDLCDIILDLESQSFLGEYLNTQSGTGSALSPSGSESSQSDTDASTQSKSGSSRSARSPKRARKAIQSKLTTAREEGGRSRVAWEDRSGNERSLIAEYGTWGGLLSRFKGAKIESHPKTRPGDFSNIQNIHKAKNGSYCTLLYTKSDSGVSKEVAVFTSIIKRTGGLERVTHIEYLGGR